MTKGSKVFCSGIETTGTLNEDVMGPLASVTLDSGLKTLVIVTKLTPLPRLNVGYRVQLGDDKKALGTITRMVNTLKVEVHFDKAIKPVIVDVRNLKLVTLSQKAEPTTERGKRRQRTKYARAARANREYLDKLERAAATKAARVASQMVGKKHRTGQQKSK